MYTEKVILAPHFGVASYKGTSQFTFLIQSITLKFGSFGLKQVNSFLKKYLCPETTLWNNLHIMLPTSLKDI